MGLYITHSLISACEFCTFAELTEVVARVQVISQTTDSQEKGISLQLKGVIAMADSLLEYV